MIEQIKIQNFQSHKKTVLNFDKGLNVIVGPTDSGKSAVIRALRWLVWNRPGGDNFRSKWGGETKIGVTIDSCTIERIKGTQNKYVLTDSGNQIEFKAIGTNVPDEIANSLNIKEVNLQKQFDQPFLLSDTPGQVAAYFNKVAGIDIIDKAMKEVRQEIYICTQKVKLHKEDLKGRRVELSKYDNLEKLEIEIEALEVIEKKLKTISKNRKKLSSIIYNIENNLKQLEQIKPILRAEKKINKLLKRYEQLKQVEKEKERLSNLLKNIVKINEKITYSKNIIKADKKVTELINKITFVTQYKNKLNTLSGLLSKLLSLTTKLNDSALEQVRKQKLFDANMPDICPLCGK